MRNFMSFKVQFPKMCQYITQFALKSLFLLLITILCAIITKVYCVSAIFYDNSLMSTQM